MKVAVVASAEVFGGAERYLCDLYYSLARDFNVEATLIGDLPGWDLKMGAQIHLRTNVKLTRRRPLIGQAWQSLKAAHEVQRCLKENYFDLVHMQYLHPKLLLTSVLARTRPVMWTEHGPLQPNLPAVGRRLLRQQGLRARIIAVSPVVRSSLLDIGLESVVIRNPLPDQRQVSIVKPPAEKVSGRLQVLYAGRLHQLKRVELFLKAAHLSPDVDFLIAGTGPDEERLRSMAPHNVSFLGHLNNEQVPYSNVDAVVITSGAEAREGSPMTMLEARSRSLPVLLARDCPAWEEARDLRCTPFSPDPRSLAEAVRELAIGETVALPREVWKNRNRPNWVQQHYETMFNLLDPSSGYGEGSR